ncbi:putative membrane protein [Wenyingzhuangia heitensis]|uniref:Membrane protein n=1 Tax=Wenyingzhuangia heitensis TaxID=1487859 RepID=A0ABX0U9C8_9FLAO|nr:phage holin family protein [Wenyingzhuangia heitensis]NIJ44964.1 putative membrane protein [Wenyingzhuangia heitensis]
MNYIIQLLVSALAVIIIANFLPGVQVDNISTAIWVALVLSVLNLLVKPILVILTLPITIFTLGIFLLVINAIIINMAAYLTSGFSVSSLWVALLFSLLLSVLQSLLSSLFGLEKK